MTEQQHTLKILQQNVRKSRSTMIEIFAEPKTLEFDIIAFQEPWRRSDCNTTYHPAKDHYELLYSNDPRTRVCMYISKNIALASWNVTHHSFDLSTLSLKTLDARRIQIHNVYNPSTSAPDASSALATLEVALNQNENEEHIVLGDFNLHHPVWGGVNITRTERASESLLEIIETHQMEQVLTPGTVTYSDKNAESTIDLVFLTPLLRDSLIICQTGEFKYGSDHYPIITRVNLRTSQQPVEDKRQFRKTDRKRLLERFSEEIQTLPESQLKTKEEIDEQVRLVITAIQRSIEFSTPLVRICKRSVPGFDCECKEAQMRARRLHKVFQRDGTEENWHRYVEARSFKKSVIKKAKRREYRESREKACQNPGTMWKAGRAARHSGPPSQACIPALKSSKGFENDPKKKIDLLQETFFPAPLEANLDDIQEFSYPQPFETEDITMQEVKRAVMGPLPYKAPGPSGIPNCILQLLVEPLYPVLHQIFNACFKLGYCPTAFKESTTIVMKKPESDDPKEPRDYSEPKAYRPIALLETIGKALETILAKRIAYLAESHGLLPKTHMGGRKCTSTEHAVHFLIEKILAAWNKGNVASALFLDVSGAFDNVSHKRLLHNLKKRRIDPRIIAWIESFLDNRTTIIKTNEHTSGKFRISIGIPQGSPLSPILYLFYNADLMEISNKYKEINSSGFIDDVMLVTAADNTAKTNELLGKAHEECLVWARKHGSKFAPKKYQLVHFTRKRNEDHSRHLTLGQYIIEAKPHGRFLGVRFDTKLNWREHINQVKEKVTKSIAGLSKLAGSTWGGNLRTVRQMYEAVVLPQMMYCCSAWYIPQDEPGHKKWILTDLETMQARAARVITGAFRATSRPALDVETYLLPIKQRLEKLTCEAMLRITTTSTLETIIEGRSKRKKRAKTPLEVITRRFELRTNQSIQTLEKIIPYVTSPWWIPPISHIARTKAEGREQHDKATSMRDQQQLVVYTDGSGINGKIGASAVAPSIGVIRKTFLGPTALYTVYSGELQGIAMALSITLDRSVSGIKHATIFTDNQGAIRSSCDPNRQSGQLILRYIVNSIDALRAQGIQVTLQWVPAHMGVEGNELADIAAKQATGWRVVRKRNQRLKEIDTQWTASTPLGFPILRAAINAHTIEYLRRQWAEEWGREKRGRELHRIMPTPTKKVLHLHKGMKKWTSALVIQMRTQKIGLRKFLFSRRVPGYEDPTCDCGRGTQGVLHLLMECPLYHRQRKELWREERRRGGWTRFDLGIILNHSKYARKAALFIKDTGLIGQFSGLTMSLDS